MQDPKYVLISGASSGIGTACAMHLEQQGYSVLAGVRRQEDGERLVEQSAGRLRWVRVDVTDSDSIAAALAVVADRVRDAGLFGLINNAGTAVAGPLEAIPLEVVRRQFDVNVFGQLAMIQAFAPMLIRARGRVVNMSSVSGRSVIPILGPYAASKFALEAMSDALRLELRSMGVRVSLVEPGVVETPIWDKSRSTIREMVDELPPHVRARYRQMIDAVEAATARSRRHAVTPQRVATIVARALSAPRPRARYVVGRDARLMISVVNRLPDRVRDWLVLRALGVDRVGSDSSGR